MGAHRLVISACIVLIASSALAQSPDYGSMFAMRSSAGFRTALETANNRLSSDPSDAAAAGVKALVYANAVDFLGMPGAQVKPVKQSALTNALKLSATNPWTRAAYGLIHMFDDPAGAERVLKECLEADPAFLECYNLYGDLLRKQGRSREAGEIYRRGLHRWPRDGELLVSNALLLQETGRIKAALDVLKRLVRKQPRFARGHWNLAVMLHESGGSRVEALREARAALALDPLIWNGDKLLNELEAE